jgi:hypothetical protein
VSATLATGTRPAPWDTKLGARRATETLPLRTLRSDGGSAARVLVGPCTRRINLAHSLEAPSLVSTLEPQM